MTFFDHLRRSGMRWEAGVRIVRMLASGREWTGTRLDRM